MIRVALLIASLCLVGCAEVRDTWQRDLWAGLEKRLPAQGEDAK